MNTLPASAEMLFMEGTTMLGQGNTASAEAAFRRALELDPDLAAVHANLGLLLEQEGRLNEADFHYQIAIQLAPEEAQIHLNHGSLLAAQKRFEASEAAYRQALLLNPDAPEAWSNLGVLLACLKRESEAEYCYRMAMTLDPAYRKAQFNLAYLLLRQGNFAEGWRCLEARAWSSPLQNYLQCPRWQNEPLAGKSLLIGFEAGHGDMIQFCRYVSLVKAKGAARVSLLCHPGLKSLFSSLYGADEIIAYDEAFPASAWDYWTPLFSLPFLLETRLETIPANLPYLTAKPELISHWAGVLGEPRGNLRAGLVWQGNPHFENDAERSLPSLAMLAPLANVPGIEFFSLQKGAGEQEAENSREFSSLTNLGPELHDFSDTAAIIMNLDLVISVDTGVAHLAGALGKPCWVLLPDFKTDWRWLKERNDSPWYPEVMRLFRQESAGEWAPVIARVADALENLLAGRRLLAAANLNLP